MSLAPDTPASSAAPGTPSTAFRAVEGGPETHSGTLLVVEAYAAVWLILLVALVLGFRRQRHLDARIARLERMLGERTPP